MKCMVCVCVCVCWGGVQSKLNTTFWRASDNISCGMRYVIYDVMSCDMTSSHHITSHHAWLTTTWHDMICDMGIWYRMGWCGVVWCHGMSCDVWYDVIYAPPNKITSGERCQKTRTTLVDNVPRTLQWKVFWTFLKRLQITVADNLQKTIG